MKPSVIIRSLAAVLLVFGVLANVSALAQDSSYAEGQQIRVTDYTYLPDGRVLATTSIQTVERSRNPLVSIHFIGTQTGMIRARNATDRALRIQAAKEVYELGFNADWRYFTYQDLANITLRIRKANELRAANVNVDWHSHQAWELLDMLDVVNLEKQLSGLGVVLNPKVTDVSKLREILSRVQKAKDLEAKGMSVDWRQHSFEELSSLEAKKSGK